MEIRQTCFYHRRILKAFWSIHKGLCGFSKQVLSLIMFDKTPSKIKQRYRGQIFLLTHSMRKYWKLLKTLSIGQSLTHLAKRTAFSTLYVMFLLKPPEKNVLKKNVLAKALDLGAVLKQYPKNELQLLSMFYISLICLGSILALDHRNLTITEPFLLYKYKKISCRSFFESD